MTSRAERIYLDLAAYEGLDREVYLAAACGGDDELRAEVERLERTVAATDAAMRDAIGSAAAQAEGRRRIGPYRVVRQIGHGGMGTVYLAVRDDDEYEKAVAIKVARASFSTEESLSRFRYERQILATLEHPNIARLLEGGTTRDGEPYIVMEYVDGVSIVEFTRELSLRGKLQLFLKVAAAVEHAHRHLIVHRDLKPSNILVDAEGEPKLIDFGIAKILRAEADPAVTAMPLVSPGYSSPEQVQGQTATAASDVYSLGVVLGEILSGSRTPARGGHGDLDTIVGKAVSLEPLRRYASVREFAADVERFLDGRPVEARAAATAYRLRKFLGRNRAGVAVAAVLLLTVAGGWLATLREARRTQMRLTQVRQMANTMLFDLHDRIKSLPGSTEARVHLVETAQRYLASLEPDAPADPEVAAEIAAGYERLGDLQGGPEMANVGRVGMAVESYRKSLALRERLAGGGAQALRELSRVQVKTANAMAQRGGSAEALVLLNKAVESAGRAREAAPDDPEMAGVVMEAEYRLADWLLRKGRAAEALPHAGRGLAVAREFARQRPGPAGRQAMLTALRRYGDASHQSGQMEEAHRYFTEAVSLAGEGSESREKMLLTLAQGNVAGNPLYLNLGNAALAEEHYRSALAWAAGQAERDPKNAGARADLAIATSKLASSLWESEPGESARLYDQAIAIRSEQVRHAPENVEFIRVLAYDLANSANALRRLGQAAEAERRARRALELDAEMTRRDPVRVECCSDIPLYAIQLGDAQWDLGQRAEAGASYRRAAEVAEYYGRRETCGVFCMKDWATALEKVTVWQSRMGDRAAAGEWAERARRVWQGWIERNATNAYVEKRLKELGSLPH